jgi:hypothetical protein
MKKIWIKKFAVVNGGASAEGQLLSKKRICAAVKRYEKKHDRICAVYCEGNAFFRYEAYAYVCDAAYFAEIKNKKYEDLATKAREFMEHLEYN